ncbi:hypothetical protein QBC43DRAFT_114853 [Cladorrhinum sp. PSN259]|nr:hypothetical protein QBC43DRAFT_114853 [Cladorrhinum sp. PSN259]
MASPSKLPVPRIDASTSWLLLEDETIEARLQAVVAQVLRINPEKIHIHESSFKDLGGNEHSAAALRKACMDAGMDVKVKDILRCSTLSELQSCITPCPPQPQYSEAESAESAAAVAIEPAVATPLDISRTGRTPTTPVHNDLHSRKSSYASSVTLGGQRTEIEQSLGIQPELARIATVRPKAGLLEGKLIALMTLSGIQVEKADPSAIDLIPQSHALYAGTQVARLKQTAESVLPEDDIPDLWIVLDAMPANEAGEIDVRRLRTWAQNINEDVHHRALSMEHQETLQAPESQMEKTLQRLVSKILDIPQAQIGVNFSFCQLGGDETMAVELAARCKDESIYIHASEALGSTTLSELAALAATRGGLAHKWDEETLDCFDLSPMQHLYFQTPMGGDLGNRVAIDGSYRFNQSLLLRFKRKFSFADISAAIEAVVGHHPMLRARFGRGLQGWVQRVLPDVEGSYTLHHHEIRSDQELEDIIQKTQLSVDIETGPVFSAEYLTTHDDRQLLYLVAHHLAIDLRSWRTIIHDLDELLDNGSLLSQRSMPFHKWVDVQKAEVESRDPRDLLPFHVQPGDYSYWGLQDTQNTYGDATEVSFSLSNDLTSILQTSCNQVFQTDCVDIYLAVLMLSFAQTFNDRSIPVVWNQESGRDHWNPDHDISETVGWFTSLCPVVEKVESGDDVITVLRHLKDTRRSIPSRGAQYFASRFYHYDKAELVASDWPFEIMFTYAGSLQHLERDNGVMEQLAIPGRNLGSPTSDIGSNVGRIALFEVSAMVDKGSAKVKFIYSKFSKDQQRISQWVQHYEHLLLDTIEKLRSHPQELTLADVPHLDVTYEGLQTFNTQRLATLNLPSVRDIETIYPVTAVQQSILISQAQRPDTCYLHAIYEFASPTGEPIDISRICTAWQQVTMRHAALRTVFTESVSVTGLWDKVILRRASPEMLFIDTAPTEDPVHELGNLPNLRPTHSKPLHRLTVCKAPTRTLVKLDISTALCDSISIHLLLDDLRRTYATERAINEPEQFHYPRYLWFLKSVRQEVSLDYWREKLTGVPPCHFPRLTVLPDEQRFINSGLELDITSYDLSAFTRTHKTTVAAVLRLAWGLLLRVYTGSNQVCFGFQTAGRDESNVKMRHAVGSFANTVACCFELLTYSPLSLALQKVEDELVQNWPHQHFTMAELQHAMGVKGAERLFNSCLTFTEEPAGLNSKYSTRTSFELKPITLQQTFDTDVVVNTRFSSGKLFVDIGQRILSPDQAIAVASTFGKAIRAILTAPNSSVGLVDLFSDRDYAQILAWDAESPQLTEGQSHTVVHDLVSRQAEIQPSSQAICSWDGSYTYAQLEEEATKLAHHLVDVGVGPHSVVPVVMDKCRLAPLAMLAVLKSGAAFVPIDSLELGMIQPIFERLNSRVAISSELAAPILSNLFEQVVVVTDELMGQLPENQGPVTSMAAPTDAACILFVPTSSNEARGVTFSHAALSTALIGQGPAAHISPLSRVMQLSSFNVDICITEIFTTLAYGACVCVPSAAERLQDFGAAVNRMQVNWTYMTPMLSRKLDPMLLPSLQVVCFRTRSLDDDTYNIWHGKASVVLAYGPQDVCPLGISFLEAMGTHHLRSIGRPFCGTLQIVNPDDHKKRVPVGAVGELVVEGPTLGFSYPNRESTLTQMSALGTMGSKARYFKTGHRARYTQGGLMEFISSKREDIELDGKIVNVTDIEQYLRRCLGLGMDVIVDIVAFRGQADPILAAFVEFGDRLEAEETLSNLGPATKELLATTKRLVEFGLKNRSTPSMVPTVFIPVKHLPVTASLKVNRKRLQKMINGMTIEELYNLATIDAASEAKLPALKPLPLTESEEKMRSIWARVLGFEEAKISALDTFFGVGGDAILAAQLVTACRHEGITVDIADILRNGTLTEISRAIITAETPQSVHPIHAAPSAPASPVPKTASASPAPSNPNNIKEVFIEKVIAPKIGVDPSAIADAAEASSVQIRYIETGMLRGRANINYLTFNFTGVVDAKKLETACRTLITIHPILRTVFVPYNRRVYQAVLKSADIEFRRQYCPTWRLANLLDKVIRKDQSSGTRFETPMTKFIFLDGSKQSILVLRLSKAQYDDLSVALLVKDLKRLYDGSQAAPKRPSYCEFLRCTQVANAAGAEEYWRALLEGAVMTQVVGHTQPYQMSTHTKTVRNPMLSLGSLRNLGFSFETVLKSAWAMVLAALSATPDVVFGELIDGRRIKLPNNSTVLGVMGPTVNIIPIRVQFPDTSLTPLGLLQYVHNQHLASAPFENLGSLSIVEKCTPWPYWTRFSTVLQHQTEDTAILPSEPKSFHLGGAACKFTINESRAQDMPDLLIRSFERPPGRVDLTIQFCSERVPEAFAERALQMLAANIGVLTTGSLMQEVIPMGSQYRGMMKRIPMTPSSPPLASGATDSASLIASMAHEQVQAIRQAVSNTWLSILNPLALGVPDDQVHNAAFYDLWGSLIPASQMMQQLNRELPKVNIPGADSNLKVTMEEIIENPTMLKQFELIASKVKPQGFRDTQRKDKAKEPDRGLSDSPKPISMQESKRKPSMNISVGAPSTSLGTRIRRLASTVARTNSPPVNSINRPSTASSMLNSNNPPPPTPTTPVAIGLASAMVAEMSPKIISTISSPSLSSTFSSRGPNSAMTVGSFPSPGPPQLPTLPSFEPIAEEAEHHDGQLGATSALGKPFRQASPLGADSVDSMTDGSSAVTHGIAVVDGSAAGPGLGLEGVWAGMVIPEPTLQADENGSLVAGGPPGAGIMMTPKSRYSAGGGAAARQGSPEMKETGSGSSRGTLTRAEVWGKTGMTPIVE